MIEQPWTRVRVLPPLPEPLTAQALRSLEQEEFAQLLRTLLIPRDSTPAARQDWTLWWQVMSGHDDLVDRAFDVLEDFLDVTAAAIEDGELEQAQAKRARAFVNRCEDAWAKLERVDFPAPLAWAGSAGQFSPGAAKVIARLISGIARHRSAVLRSPRAVAAEDQRLWDVMKAVGLDPRDYDT